MKFERLIVQQGYNPATFFKYADIDRQVIYNYRSGKRTPSLENIKKIAKALNVSTDTVIACF